MDGLRVHLWQSAGCRISMYDCWQLNWLVTGCEDAKFGSENGPRIICDARLQGVVVLPSNTFAQSPLTQVATHPHWEGMLANASENRIMCQMQSTEVGCFAAQPRIGRFGQPDPI